MANAVKAFKVLGACIEFYLAFNFIYELGKESGKKEIMESLSEKTVK